MMTQTRRFSLYSMFTALLLSPLASADILIDDPYVREPVPGRNMSAAFMSVRNTAAEDAVLVKIWSELGNENLLLKPSFNISLIKRLQT